MRTAQRRIKATLANPVRLRRTGLGLVFVGAVLAGLAAALRHQLPSGTSRHSGTYVLDVLSLAFAIAGAVAEARVGDIWLNARVRQARARALLLTTIGSVVCLGSCVALSAVAHLGVAPSVLGSAALVTGIGLALGGVFTLAWHYGGHYAAHRLNELDDDW